ncbi:MAG: hypothetical protein UY64_C0031G0019, partial [Parcubacteria group bacterium GW2011_GWA1_51_12]
MLKQCDSNIRMHANYTNDGSAIRII